MRKVLLLIVMLCVATYCYSNEFVYVKMRFSFSNTTHDGSYSYNSEDRLFRRRAPMVLPSVGYNDSGVFIQCSYPLYDVEVQIKDESGICLLDTVVDVQNEVCIELSGMANAEKYSIELIYGDSHLYGEFI